MSTTRGEFLTDIETLRRRAREHIEEGARTRGYQADRDTVLRLLNEALATEIVCVLRYIAKEEEHAKDLVDLLATLDPTKPA